VTDEALIASPRRPHATAIVSRRAMDRITL